MTISGIGTAFTGSQKRTLAMFSTMIPNCESILAVIDSAASLFKSLLSVSTFALAGSGPCARATMLCPVRKRKVKKRKSLKKRGDMTIFRRK
jgi:hypothetical protein